MQLCLYPQSGSCSKDIAFRESAIVETIWMISVTEPSYGSSIGFGWAGAGSTDLVDAPNSYLVYQFPCLLNLQPPAWRGVPLSEVSLTLCVQGSVCDQNFCKSFCLFYIYFCHISNLFNNRTHKNGSIFIFNDF